MSEKKNGVVFQEERLEKIVVMLDKKERLLTNELCDELDISVVTIRKDLSILEKRGLLKRTHGGAIKTNKLYSGLSLNEKEKINRSEKLLIVKKAAELISDGDTIILDSGSTTYLLAKEIKMRNNLTVITNALNIAAELTDSNVNVIVIGGFLIKDTLTQVGPLADNMLSQISAGKVFLGVDGIDLAVGLTTPNIQEAHTSKTMMHTSGEVIVLADSSKFGRRSLGVISKVGDIDILITTKELPEEELQYYIEHEVEILKV